MLNCWLEFDKQMYTCIWGIDFVSTLYYFSIRNWNCSDSVVYFVFHDMQIFPGTVNQSINDI